MKGIAMPSLYDSNTTSQLVICRDVKPVNNHFFYHAGPIIAAILACIAAPVSLLYLHEHPIRPEYTFRGGGRPGMRGVGACFANMRVLEGSVDMWEMDQDTSVFPGGPITREGENGHRLAPVYVRKIPRCRSGGTYNFNSQTHTVYCDAHGSVDNPGFLNPIPNEEVAVESGGWES